MKIRNGFVSNSSSSSFLVAIPSKKVNDDIFEINIQLKLKVKLNELSEFQNSIIIHNQIELEKWFDEYCDRYGTNRKNALEDEYLSKMYHDILKHIGTHIMFESDFDKWSDPKSEMIKRILENKISDDDISDIDGVEFIRIEDD